MISNSVLFACSGIAFIWGVVKFFKRKVPLFNQLIACALGCMMLGRLFNIVILLTSGNIPYGFSVGKLGFIGCFLFLFSASYGQMNGLVDGGEKEFAKYRLLALLAPITIVLSYLIVLLSSLQAEDKVVIAMILASIACCSYYNMKHLIIPDIDMGIIRSIRGYNMLALVLEVLTAAEVISAGFNSKIAVSVFNLMLCVVYLLMVPVLERGAKKWTI